jgi:DNA-binding transcriptional LysR family regulator
MQLRNVDLNLLVIADALYRHRNVSRAATELGLSQSAVSHALARLRKDFDDPLFVRTAKGVLPTEFARSIQADLVELVQRADRLLNRRAAFDPAVARGRIVFSTTDYVEVVLMPKLLKTLAREAPGLQVSIRPTGGELPKRGLEEGSVDLAIAGFYENLPEGFYQAKLFSDTFSSATRKGHPIVRDRLGIDDFFALEHALITLSGDFKDKITTLVGKKRRERRIVYGSYSFTGLAWVLAEADFVLTAPTLLIEAYAQHFPIKAWKCPIDVGSIDLQMVWHEQTHRDPLRVWLRARIKDVCAKLNA